MHMAETQKRKVRNFRVKVDGYTLPGAGMHPGTVSGRPFAHRGEVVSEDELGTHILGLFDAENERVLQHLEEIEASEEEAEVDDGVDENDLRSRDEIDRETGSEEQGTAPWEDYDSLSVAQVQERLQADPSQAEAVKRYEGLQRNPRKGILNFEPGGAA